MQENGAMEKLGEFLAFCTDSRGFSAATTETYSAAIRDFSRVLEKTDPATVTAQDLDLYMTRKALAGTAVSTRRARAHALRAFFGFLHTRKFIEQNPAEFFRPP